MASFICAADGASQPKLVTDIPHVSEEGLILTSLGEGPESCVFGRFDAHAQRFGG